jgi:transcriptional regulator with XRE-family HTH domain
VVLWLAAYYCEPIKQRVLVEIGERIRFHRKQRDLSQEKVAELAGLDRAYYGGVERGERNVSAQNLVKIALALKVEVGELFPSIPNLRKASYGR